MKVTIVGAGSMARGIGTRVLAGGSSVELVHADAGKAADLAAQLEQGTPGATVSTTVLGEPVTGEIVVLAVPYEAVPAVVRSCGPSLAGVVVVDITNPVDWQTMDRLTTPPGVSAAEQTAEIVPDGVHVVKAFNTTFAGPLTAGSVAGLPLDVFIAGDDTRAKDRIAELVTAGGLRCIDVGELRRARELEAFQLLHIRLQGTLGTGYGSALKLMHE